METDWTPIGDAISARGGILGGGIVVLCEEGEDGLMDVRAALVVNHDLPEPLLGDAEPDPLSSAIFGMPLRLEASVRTEERDAVLPVQVWRLLAALAPNHPAWSGGAITFEHADGISWSRVRGLSVRSAASVAAPEARPRGRPRGPKYDDTKALEAALLLIKNAEQSGQPRLSNQEAASAILSLASGPHSAGKLERLARRLGRLRTGG